MTNLQDLPLSEMCHPYIVNDTVQQNMHIVHPLWSGVLTQDASTIKEQDQNRPDTCTTEPVIIIIVA